MVTEVSETKVFDIEAARTELAALNERNGAIMGELIAAGQNADVTAMTKLGTEMGEIASKIKRLSSRISRAENGDSSSIGLATRISTRDAAMTAIVNELQSGSDVAQAIRVMLAASSGIKEIRIAIENGSVASASVVGGFRKITATGIKRPRASWGVAGESVDSGKSTKEAVQLYASKYGATKSYADMTSNERHLLMLKIAEGEGFVNLNAKEVAATPAS